MPTVIQSGTVSLSNTVDKGVTASVSFSSTFSSTPAVVTYMPTYAGSQTVFPRAKNVTTSGCDIHMEEPDNQGHSGNTVVWIAAETGSWVTSEGRRIEAGIHNTNTVRDSSNSAEPIGDLVSLNHEWESAPVIVHNLQTYNNGAAMATQANTVTKSDFRLSQERMQFNSSTSSEDIGYIAIEDTNKSGKNFDATTVETNWEDDGATDGVDDTAHTISFGYGWGTAPDIVVSGNSLRGADGYATRGGGMPSTTAHDTYALEDQTADTERNHANEYFGYIAFPHGASINASKAANYVGDGSTSNTLNSDDSITVSWNTPTNASHYIIEESKDNSAWTKLATVGGASTSYTTSPKTIGPDVYEHRVRSGVDYYLDGGAGSGQALIVNSNITAGQGDDFDFVFRGKGQSNSGGEAGIFIGAQNTNKKPNNSGYWCGIRPGKDDIGIWRLDSGSWTKLKTAAVKTYFQQKYTPSVSWALDGTITLSIAGTSVTAIDTTYTSGYVGWRVYHQGAEFEELQINGSVVEDFSDGDIAEYGGSTSDFAIESRTADLDATGYLWVDDVAYYDWRNDWPRSDLTTPPSKASGGDGGTSDVDLPPTLKRNWRNTFNKQLRTPGPKALAGEGTALQVIASGLDSRLDGGTRSLNSGAIEFGIPLINSNKLTKDTSVDWPVTVKKTYALKISEDAILDNLTAKTVVNGSCTASTNIKTIQAEGSVTFVTMTIEVDCPSGSDNTATVETTLTPTGSNDGTASAIQAAAVGTTVSDSSSGSISSISGESSGSSSNSSSDSNLDYQWTGRQPYRRATIGGGCLPASETKDVDIRAAVEEVTVDGFDLRVSYEPGIVEPTSRKDYAMDLAGGSSTRYHLANGNVPVSQGDTIKVTWKATGGGTGVFIAANSGSVGDGYLLQTDGGDIGIWRRDNGGYTNLKRVNFGGSWDTEYTATVEWQSDGTLTYTVGSWSVSATDTTYTSGYAGFSSYDKTQTVDDLRVNGTNEDNFNDADVSEYFGDTGRPTFTDQGQELVVRDGRFTPTVESHDTTNGVLRLTASGSSKSFEYGVDAGRVLCTLNVTAAGTNGDTGSLGLTNHSKLTHNGSELNSVSFGGSSVSIAAGISVPSSSAPFGDKTTIPIKARAGKNIEEYDIDLDFPAGLADVSNVADGDLPVDSWSVKEGSSNTILNVKGSGTAVDDPTLCNVTLKAYSPEKPGDVKKDNTGEVRALTSTSELIAGDGTSLSLGCSNGGQYRVTGNITKKKRSGDSMEIPEVGVVYWPIIFPEVYHVPYLDTSNITKDQVSLEVSSKTNPAIDAKIQDIRIGPTGAPNSLFVRAVIIIPKADPQNYPITYQVRLVIEGVSKKPVFSALYVTSDTRTGSGGGVGAGNVVLSLGEGVGKGLGGGSL